MSAQLEKIIKDKKSGSTTLVLKLNKYFKEISGEPDRVLAGIEICKKQFLPFQIILNYLEILESIINQQNNIENFLDTFENDILTAEQNIYNNAKPELLKLNSVFTLSNSHTLSEIFKYMHLDNSELKVIIAESRPALEGRNLAKELLKLKIDSELIVDSAMAFYIGQSDGVVISADIILKNGNVVNKIGSRSAAIIAKYFKKPFYVVASRYKISDTESYSPEMKSPHEVWLKAPAGLSVYNFYFEEIEKELITKVFTD